MNDAPSVPSGPLHSVHRPWDYKNGWVRAPIREIVCNSSLSKQARLLWLWLASLKEGSPDYTWKDCEIELDCQTKARKNCLGQLISQGFLEISDEGIAILKDPYIAYSSKKLDSERKILTSRSQIRHIEVSEIALHKEEIVKVEEKPKKTTPVSTVQRPTENDRQRCIDSWNFYKPDTYSSLNSFGNDRWQALVSHMSNLNYDKNDVEGFIKIICKGLNKDDWWVKECTNRSYEGIFGSGKVQEKKRGNVQKFYDLGLVNDEAQQVLLKETKETFNNELANLKYRLDLAKARRNQLEIDKWQAEIDKFSETIFNQETAQNEP